MLLLTRDVVSTVWRAVFGCFPLPHRWIICCFQRDSTKLCEECYQQLAVYRMVFCNKYMQTFCCAGSIFCKVFPGWTIYRFQFFNIVNAFKIYWFCKCFLENITELQPFYRFI